jgi:SAM-dependent methyltransferase
MTTTLQKDQADPARTGFYKGMEVRQNDEYGRLRRQHLLHKNVMHDKLIRVPLNTDQAINILDSGTGDGIWMLDALDEYPNATFTGTDIFPKHFEQLKHLLPASISFKVQNLLDDWPAEDGAKYDLVHQRYCLAQFNPEKDAEIVKNLFSLVKPGGFIQFIEADMISFEGGEGHEGMSKFMQFVETAFPQVSSPALSHTKLQSS